jgi:hypothetical protein
MTTRIPDGPWTLSLGMHEGKPMVVRINTGAADHAGDSRYGHRLDVRIPFQSQHPLGLPGPEESARLGAVEDELVSALSADGTAALVLSITKAGMRELVFYTSSSSSVEAQLGSIKTARGELQHVLNEDPRWSAYKQFAGSADDDA